MRCDEYQELISAEIDNELSAPEEPSLWEHLAVCGECRAWRRDQLRIRLELGMWPEEMLPEPDTAVTGTPPPPSGVYRVPRLLAWAAGLAILLQGAYLASGLTGRSASPPSLAVPETEVVETIVLSTADRVSHSIQRVQPTSTLQRDPTRNGG